MPNERSKKWVVSKKAKIISILIFLVLWTVGVIEVLYTDGYEDVPQLLGIVASKAGVAILVMLGAFFVYCLIRQSDEAKKERMKEEEEQQHHHKRY